MFVPAATDNKNTTGWQARLELGYGWRHGRTTLLHRRHVGPLRVQKPFYPEDEVVHTYLLHPPGGMVGGDDLTVNVHLEPKAHALITNPGANKIYRTRHQPVYLRQDLQVDGTLEWLPQETIVFDGGALEAQTTLHLGAGARFILWELPCLGRPAANEAYTDGSTRLKTRIVQGSKLLYEDHFQLKGGDRVYSSPVGLNGNSASGSMLAYPVQESLVTQLRSKLEIQPSIQMTCMDQLLVVRGLANQSQELKNAFIDVWQELRPQLLSLPAVRPRIWNT